MSRAGDPDREIARELRLRADPARVARLSRRSLALLAGAAALAVAAVAGWSLSDHRRPPAGPALGAEDGGPPAPPQLAELPADYAAAPRDVPRLGPPLPGDLGRPILAAKPNGAGASDAEAQDTALRQATLAAKQARTSRLAAPTTARAAPAAEPAPAAGAGAAAPEAHVLQAGSIVRAALVTGIRSDLPGPVVAQVTEDVFDSRTGRWKLIPQGARLVGTYEAGAGSGHGRVPLVWTRLLLPDGRSVDLDREPAADETGFAGLADGVDRHWRRLVGAALVSSLLAMGAEAGAGRTGSELADAVRAGAAQTANQAGQQLVGRTLDAGPSLTVRPGFPVRMLVTKDLTLDAWRG